MKKMTIKLVLFLSFSLSAVFTLAGESVSFPKEMIGTYEYVYPDSTPDLIENHYIVITKENSGIVGKYYGTSDDFDDAREGYLPGFYVAKIKNLMLNGNKISFDVTISDDDLFLNNIGHTVKSSKEVKTKDHPRWIHDYMPGFHLSKKTIHLSGMIIGHEIHIQTNYGIRLFKRLK